MPIERYLFWGGAEPFIETGSCTVYDHPLFRWYLAERRIGLSARMLKDKPAPFTYGFLTWGDTLVVRQMEGVTELWRDVYPKGVLSEKNGAGHHVADLADLLNDHDGIHAFETSPPGSTIPNVLTFSVQPPVSTHYRKIKPMGVVIRDWYGDRVTVR